MTGHEPSAAGRTGTCRASLDADMYDEEYYTHCEGYEAYTAEATPGLSTRLQVALDHASLRPGMRVLDVGCGRGELAYHCAYQGAKVWAIDYSPIGVRLAARALDPPSNKPGHPAAAGLANALAVPFASGTFDIVFMLDLVEHLYPWQLVLALAQVFRVLRPGGRLVLHTMPNRWCHEFGYPLSRFFNRIRGRSLPPIAHGRSEYHRRYHVNEMDILSLRAALRRAGLAARVWADNQSLADSSTGKDAILPPAIARLPGLNLIACNELLAVATKREP